MASSSSVKKCPLCNFQALDNWQILSHLHLVHSSDPNFSVMCGIGGCCTTFKSFPTLYQYIYKKHKGSGVIQPRRNSNQGSMAQLDDATMVDNQLYPGEFGDHSESKY